MRVQRCPCSQPRGCRRGAWPRDAAVGSWVSGGCAQAPALGAGRFVPRGGRDGADSLRHLRCRDRRRQVRPGDCLGAAGAGRSWGASCHCRTCCRRRCVRRASRPRRQGGHCRGNPSILRLASACGRAWRQAPTPPGPYDRRHGIHRTRHHPRGHPTSVGKALPGAGPRHAGSRPREHANGCALEVRSRHSRPCPGDQPAWQREGGA
mmetsp:Transcript_19997/g.76677  ORF Transcript_19997/g.76677 Transcript_19997/m.76677 type:complete len:207 (+) Transcript_19997:1602-2222(+)